MIQLRKLTQNSSKNLFFSSKPTYFPLKVSIFRNEALILNWTSQNHKKDQFLPSKSPSQLKFSHPFSKHAFSFKRQFVHPKLHLLDEFRSICTEKTTPEGRQPACRFPRVLSKAHSVLIDYLHSTSGLDYLDAEHMSKNSPIFLFKTLNKVDKRVDGIGKALSRFLRYHPPNEFELFFESIGLKPPEFYSVLPQDLMFLKDDPELLDNYHVLCNYGIARGKLGKIYKEATEVFRYKSGVLRQKLQAYQGLGLSKTSVTKVVASSPALLMGDVSREFVRVLEELEKIGIPRDWIGYVVSEDDCYHWGKMPVSLHSCLDMGFSKHELGNLIRKHPDFLLDCSGKMVVSLAGLLMKVGATREEIFSLLMEFPDISVGSFVNNLRRGLTFLIDIEMEPQDIQKLIRSRSKTFGLHTFRTSRSLFTLLNVGRKRLCRIIQEDPDQLKNYVIGSKLNRLPNSGEYERLLMRKREFLLSLGLAEDSEQMERALKQCRGKADELQERFDFLVKLGLNRTDVCNMIKIAPHVLNQKINVLERKISFLVNDLGFPLNSLVAFPQYISFTVNRVKLRFLMYSWLKDRGSVPPLALSTILACSDRKFRKRFIDSHPQGPEMWENFKKTLS